MGLTLIEPGGIDGAIADVRDFHRRLRIPTQSVPNVPNDTIKQLRKRLITEEYWETIQSLDADNLPKLADGLADLIYVALGCAAAYGIDLRPVWKLVHETNLAKENGPIREDGKRLKPDGWAPPDIEHILQHQPSLF